MPKHARQRRVPKHPHKPSSMRLGPRRLADRWTDSLVRAWAFLRWDQPLTLMLHPIEWHDVRLEYDDTGLLRFGGR